MGIIMNKNNFITAGFILLSSWGCASYEPHIFVNTYEPIPEDYFTRYEDGNATYSVVGSGFLRQQGGGTVTCGGNSVSATPVMPTSQYDNEYSRLSWSVKSATIVDPQYTLDKARLAALKATSFCDVDGKFELNDMTPGTWYVSTKITWIVMGTCGYGDAKYVCEKPQGGVRGTVVSIKENLDKKEYKIMISS